MAGPAHALSILILLVVGGAWQVAGARAAADAEGLVAGLVDAETMEVLITKTRIQTSRAPKGVQRTSGSPT